MKQNKQWSIFLTQLGVQHITDGLRDQIIVLTDFSLFNRFLDIFYVA